VTTEIPGMVRTPVAFTPRDISTTVNIATPFPTLRGTKYSSVPHDVKPSFGAYTNDGVAMVSSPTLSISTVSDLTPTELGEIEEGNSKRIAIRHETFYLEDGNVEIACGQTIFRVHSTVVSFSSPNLRDMLSPSILNAPMPGGCPRVGFKDSAEDFAVLLKMIYTPGYVPPHFDVSSVN